MIKLWMSRDVFVKWGMRIASTVILSIMALCLYWIVIDRDPPITVHSGTVVRYQPQADGSYIIFVRWHSTRHRFCAGNSRRWIDAGAILPLPDIEYPPERPNRPLGEHSWEVPISVPAYFATTGHVKGVYSIEIDYACNPLQKYMFPIEVVPPSVPFDLQGGQVETAPSGAAPSSTVGPRDSW